MKAAALAAVCHFRAACRVAVSYFTIDRESGSDQSERSSRQPIHKSMLTLHPHAAALAFLHSRCCGRHPPLHTEQGQTQWRRLSRCY
ncbi:hypothetical protein QQF64_028049 [Cirrhinus molitorella]|uniref:Secreted protein n=1 Tax=Cirrhinus molitorella TaxID=172907 RepID=A0ABR3N5U4_9TELE